jgi:hypothetical protein
MSLARHWIIPGEVTQEEFDFLAHRLGVVFPDLGGKFERNALQKMVWEVDLDEEDARRGHNLSREVKVDLTVRLRNSALANLVAYRNRTPGAIPKAEHITLWDRILKDDGL